MAPISDGADTPAGSEKHLGREWETRLDIGLGFCDA